LNEYRSRRAQSLMCSPFCLTREKTGKKTVMVLDNGSGPSRTGGVCSDLVQQIGGADAQMRYRALIPSCPQIISRSICIWYQYFFRIQTYET
jgi:hypothetical protein